MTWQWAEQEGVQILHGQRDHPMKESCIEGRPSKKTHTPVLSSTLSEPQENIEDPDFDDSRHAMQTLCPMKYLLQDTQGLVRHPRKFQTSSAGNGLGEVKKTDSCIVSEKSWMPGSFSESERKLV